MYYPFICKKCGHYEEISMPMSQYKSEGHMCPECGEEMVREVKSLVCSCSLDKTGDFYRKIN